MAVHTQQKLWWCRSVQHDKLNLTILFWKLISWQHDIIVVSWSWYLINVLNLLNWLSESRVGEDMCFFTHWQTGWQIHLRSMRSPLGLTGNPPYFYNCVTRSGNFSDPLRELEKEAWQQICQHFGQITWGVYPAAQLNLISCLLSLRLSCVLLCLWKHTT